MCPNLGKHDRQGCPRRRLSHRSVRHVCANVIRTILWIRLQWRPASLLHTSGCNWTGPCRPQGSSSKHHEQFDKSTSTSPKFCIYPEEKGFKKSYYFALLCLYFVSVKIVSWDPVPWLTVAPHMKQSESSAIVNLFWRAVGIQWLDPVSSAYSIRRRLERFTVWPCTTLFFCLAAGWWRDDLFQRKSLFLVGCPG